MARVRYEQSAGGVLLVPIGRQLLVALIRLRGGTVLALPKGHIEDGESLDQTAQRETFEETGLRGDPIGALGDISYSFYSRERRTRIAKKVSFFLMHYRAGSPAHHNDEVEGVVLVPFERAKDALAYRGEREILARAEDLARGLAGYGDSTAKERGAVTPSGVALLDLGGLACSR